MRKCVHLLFFVSILLSILMDVNQGHCLDKNEIGEKVKRQITEIKQIYKIDLNEEDLLRNIRKEKIDFYVEIIKESDDNIAQHRLRKETAINVLGMMRADEASDVFLDNLKFQIHKAIRPWELFINYPSVTALINIGSPCIDNIMVKLMKPVSDFELRKLTYALYMIDGEDLVKARLDIELSRVPSSFNVKKENLRKMIELLDGAPRSLFIVQPSDTEE